MNADAPLARHTWSTELRSILALLLVGMLLAGCSNLLSNDATFTPPPRSTLTPTAGDEAQGDPTETEPPVASATNEPDDPTATSEPEVEATATAEASPTDEATSTPGDGGGDPRIAQLEQMQGDVEQLRELPLLEDINEAIITRDELRANLEVLLDEDYSPEEAAIDAEWLWLLRLTTDRDLDLYQLQLDLLSEQVVGYYDPETKELFLISDSEELTPSDKVTMAHEITHALQDQHFDLVALQDSTLDADQDTALTALVEGDASLAMTDYLIDFMTLEEQLEFLTGSLETGSTDVLDSAPRYISEGLTFPYETGLAFVQALFDDGSWPAVDAALEDPPTSTEQIMHPEKYMTTARDEPVAVDLPDLANTLGRGWIWSYGDALGEWDLGVLLEENGVADGAALSEGWGGSWFDLYQNGDQAVTVLATVWDSDADAQAFAGGLRVSFEGTTLDGENSWTDGERFFAMIEQGDAVILVSGTDSAAVDAAAAAMAEGI